MDDNKNKIFLFELIGIVILVIFLFGVSFAFFQAQSDDAKSVDVNVSASTVDEFKFSNGDAINFSASQDNFATGGASLTSKTTATASLTANNSTNSAIENYYLYFNIEENKFTYSIGGSTPELILTITGPDGEVKEVDGLRYVTVEDNTGKSISGFDITMADGLIAIAINREITAGSANGKSAKVEEDWTFTLTFVNYIKDQSRNEDASLSAKVMIQKEKIINFVSDVCSGGENLSSCIINLSNANASSITRIYHHDGTLENGIDDGSYRYAGGRIGTYNYVCFNSTEETCPKEDLYRIIGVFNNQVKLIKATNLGGMAWDSGGSNTWSTSSLNKYLNETYLNELSSSWSDKIAETTWKVGGNTVTNISKVKPQITYQNEIINPATKNTTDNASEYKAKIGLMYASDYGFAASPSAWTRKLDNDSGNGYSNIAVTSANWLYLGIYEWLITRESDSKEVSLGVFSDGFVFTYNFVNRRNAFRATFYLNSDVTYKSGDGTLSSPICLKM